jgi:hemoglobin
MKPEPLRKTGELPDHARAARDRKRAAAEAIGITEDFIATLVERFYAAIRADAELGPIFDRHVEDWPAHLARLKQFWRSILHATGEFTGNPMRRHMALAPLGEEQFARWLNLFYATLRDIGANEEAMREVGIRARMIADSLLTGMTMQQTGLAGARAGDRLPRS